MRLRPFFLLLHAAVIVLPIRSASAASATWTGLGADSSWSTDANWSAAPAPNGTADIATFNSSGNGRSNVTFASASLGSLKFDTANCSAYTTSGPSTTLLLFTDITVSNTVTADQDLSGISFIRPANNTTVNISNQGKGLLKLGNLFAQNSVNGNCRLNFTPAGVSKGIEITGLIDNASTATRTLSILLNSDGILKINGTGGNFSGTDADGNSVTIRRGTLSINTVADAGVGRSGIGSNGRVQLGYGSGNFNKSLPYPCTFQYTGTSSSTDRPFRLADQNLSCIEVTQSSANLTLTTGITQTGTANGGGKLTKTGAGSLTLAGANAFSGATTVNGGTLILAHAAALQASTLASGSVAFSESVASRTFAIGGLNTVSNIALQDKVGNPVTIEAGSNNQSTIQCGRLTGPGGLVKTGNGTLLLAAHNTFSGPTVVRSGTLKLGRSTLPAGLDIMPMGDSITYGDRGTDAGYRGPLLNLLNPVAAGFTCVGSLTTVQANRSLPPEQLHHEGHSGWTAAQLTAGHFLAPGNGVDPDVILLQIGTNDLLAAGYTTQLHTNLETLLTQLTTNRPTAHIILARIPPTSNRNGVAEYNSMVEALAATFQAAGNHISVTDNNSNFPAGGLADGTHPNDTGYEWLAKQWFAALFSVFSSGGTSHALSQSSSVTVEANATLDLNDNSAATGSVAILPGGDLTACPAATLVSGGSVNLAGNLVFSAPPGLAPGGSFTILQKTSPGAITGTFANLPEASTFVASGYEWRITYTGGDGNDIVLTLVKALTAMDTWRMDHFGSTANSGNAADSFDANSDGESNLLEFATGLNPHAATRVTTTLLPSTAADFEFIYNRNQAAVAEGYGFSVEYSDTLANSQWTAFGPGAMIFDGPLQTLKAMIPASMSGKRFARLEITSP